MKIQGKGRSKHLGQTLLIGVLMQNAGHCPPRGDLMTCISKQGLLGENCQPGAAVLLLKIQAKWERDKREMETKSSQGDWEEFEF